MLITSMDAVSVNGAEDDVVLIFKEGRHAPPQPLALNSTLRQRASLPPVRESSSFQALQQPFVVAKRSGASISLADFNRLVYGLFAPSVRPRVLIGHMEDNVDLTNTALITSFGETNFAEWKGTFQFTDPIWSATSDSVEDDFTEPLVITGNMPAFPTLKISGGDLVKRQRVTYTDRTGHGVSAYDVAVTPDEEWDEHQYVIHANGLEIPFLLEDGVLYFRIDAPPPPGRMFVDIHMGEEINNTVTAGRMDPAGTVLNSGISSGSISADTATAISNPEAPSLSWHPAPSYPHEDRRNYVFGLDGTDIVLVDADVADEHAALPNDVDSYVIVTGSETERIRNLNLDIVAGYQPSVQEASGGSTRNPVMRVVIKKYPIQFVGHGWLGNVSQWNEWLPGDQTLDEHGHYAQWTLGLTTFPTIDTTTMDGRTDNSVTSELTQWLNHVTEESFEDMVEQYLDGVSVSQGEEGIYYLTFDQPPPEMPLMSMSVNSKQGQLTLTPANGGTVTRKITGIVPVIVFESMWVDPVTKEPLEDSAETNGLLPDPLRGQAKAVVKYQTREGEPWINAWSQVVTGVYPSGTSVSLSGLNIATPNAVKIAIGLEPVARRAGMVDWARLQVTSVPIIDLQTDKMPAAVVSAPISAMQINRTLRNLTTGARIRLINYLADGGVEIDTALLDIRGLGGVGPTYGELQTNHGTALFQLMPGENDIQADDTELTWRERLAL